MGGRMEQFFQSVARSFEGNRQALPRVELAILILLALAVLLQLAGLARALLARRSRFHRLLSAHGVTPEDARFAAALAARGAVEPLLLVTHPDVFERLTAQALAPGAPDPEAAAQAIHRLRHALGWDRLPAHTPLLTTRELAPGVALDVADQRGAVVEVDEAGFTVEVREPPSLPAGQQASLTLAHAREARYALGCRLAGAHPQPGGGWHLRLEHDEHPVRLQQREFVRIPVDAPITLRPVDPWRPGLPRLEGERTGRLLDLSGGGALALCPAPLPAGALAWAAFTLDGVAFDGLRAVVLASRPDPGGGHRVHLEFSGRVGAERERLVAALTHHELRLQAEAAGLAPGDGR